jgi:hypothetical protein
MNFEGMMPVCTGISAKSLGAPAAECSMRLSSAADASLLLLPENQAEYARNQCQTYAAQNGGQHALAPAAAGGAIHASSTGVP